MGCSFDVTPRGVARSQQDSGRDLIAGDAGLAATDADAATGGSGGTGGEGAGAGDGGPAATQPPGPPKNPWIAFTRIESSFGQLYFVKADGSGLRQFTGAASEQDPAWSPDGKQLAFVQFDALMGNSLHVLDFAKGTDTAIKESFSKLTRPRWSPDGKTLVVAASTAAVPVPVLFRVELASGATAQITQSVNGDGGHDIAADGSLYFVRHLDGALFDIFSVSYRASPNTTAKRVTTGSNVIGGVTVHPDSKRLYYSSAPGTTSSSLIELTLANARKRTIGDPGDEEPRALPGGKKLVLNRRSFGAGSEIAVVDGNGKLLQRCTSDPDFDTAPDASPLQSAAVDLSKF